jgi:hypothetical protein
VAYLQLLLWNSLGETEENHDQVNSDTTLSG